MIQSCLKCGKASKSHTYHLCYDATVDTVYWRRADGNHFTNFLTGETASATNVAMCAKCGKTVKFGSIHTCADGRQLTVERKEKRRRGNPWELTHEKTPEPTQRRAGSGVRRFDPTVARQLSHGDMMRKTIRPKPGTNAFDILAYAAMWPGELTVNQVAEQIGASPNGAAVTASQLRPKYLTRSRDGKLRPTPRGIGHVRLRGVREAEYSV